MAAFEFGLLSLRIGRILATEPSKEHWTCDVAKRLDINRGTVHKILKKFEREGWLRSRSCQVGQYTVRVVYELTQTGSSEISAALAPFQLSPMST